MNDEILIRLFRAPVIPLVQTDDAEIAIRVTEALLRGGLSVVELVLRTRGALQCLAATSKACPEAIMGAGTVLRAEQAVAAIDAGAEFIVSPGLDETVVSVANEHSTMVIPGVATASEAQRAWKLGLGYVKIFPASIVGGPGLLNALGSVFGEMKFMPTGGLSAKNLAKYLAIPSVFACGGSWLTPAEAVASGDFERISSLANEAVEIARVARGV
jgi:2-dehydro-3-deoxyphosphogluconate aldolase/(4S)-4-hydroxy-2-oxoglutarate aldolase